MAGHSLIACPHCGRVHVRLPLPDQGQAACSQCGAMLYRSTAVPLQGWIALTLAALIVFGLANMVPLGTLTMAGLHVQATLLQALNLIWQQGHFGLWILAGLFAFLVPLTQLLFLLWALLCLRSGKLPWDFPYGLRMLHWLKPWSMIPVLLLGIVVAIVKLAGMAKLDPGPGIAAFVVLTVLMTILSRATPLRIWRQAEDAGLVVKSGTSLRPGELAAACGACGHVQGLPDTDASTPCVRCDTVIYWRKPNALPRAAALALAACIFYVPANVLPVMWVTIPTGQSSHTILGGVIELWQLGSWDLALIVFIASVVVPITKLLALGLLMTRRHWRGDRVQRQRTHLYEMVEFIGHWSMLDIFVVVLLTAMADFPGLSQVQAGSGAIFFGMVVVLTMLAALSFDPRQGWDARPDTRRAVALPAHAAEPDADMVRSPGS